MPDPFAACGSQMFVFEGSAGQKNFHDLDQLTDAIRVEVENAWARGYQNVVFNVTLKEDGSQW